MYLRCFSVALSGLMLFFVQSMEAKAALILYSNYEFNNTLSDSLGNSADLIAIGAPTFGVGTMVFGEPDGLSLSTPITAGDYRIELDFEFTQLGQYNKLIDFQNRTVDDGLYVNPFNNVDLYGSFFGFGSTVLQPNTPYTIGLDKLGGTTSVYLNGLLEFSFAGTSAVTSPFSTLFFFADDFAFSGEGAIGAVDAIRLYTSASPPAAVPEPGSAAILGIGGIAMTWLRRRKNSSAGHGSR